jgi:hypothetical protein
MCPTQIATCPHCERPHSVRPIDNESFELAGRRLCGDCQRKYLEETADTLFANVTSRLEVNHRSRCSNLEIDSEQLPTGIVIRRALRVESLRDLGRVSEVNFDYGASTLSIAPRAESGAGPGHIYPCQFPITDIRLNPIVTNIVAALALARDNSDRSVGREVGFGEAIASILISFQQPCRHIPRCSDF